jgi:hypothetical protein
MQHLRLDQRVFVMDRPEKAMPEEAMLLDAEPTLVEPISDAERLFEAQLAAAADWHEQLRLIFELEGTVLRRREAIDPMPPAPRRQ